MATSQSDFLHSVFQGGVNACADGHGSCAQYVVRGKYPVADRPHPVRAVHPLYGVLPGGPAKAESVSETIEVQSFFHAHNDLVYVNMKDAVAADGPFVFPRPYERAMWATSGLCVSDSAPDGVDFSPLDASGGFPPQTPLSDSGIYCVASRPLPADGGARAMVQTRIATVPEVVTSHQVFDPVVERSPIIYQIVLDLDIPVPDRCESAIQGIEALVQTYLRAGSVPVRQLPTINLAMNDGPTGGPSRCAQVNGRTLPAADMADAVKQVVGTFLETYQQFHFLYFNNLNSPLPDTLTQSLRALFDALAPSPTTNLQTLSWLFNPGAAAISNVDLGWWRMTNWVTANDDPSFEQALAEYSIGTLPYETQLHDSNAPVPLLSSEEVALHAGQLIKICVASPPVFPVSGQSLQPIPGPSWTISSADPPAYLVGLDTQIAAPSNQFVEKTALVNYQICTRYCVDHPYLTDAGLGVQSWAASALCASKDY